MRIRILVLFLMLGSLGYSQSVLGDWNGILNIQGTQLRIVFHISETGGTYTATLDSPDQKAFGIPAGETTFAENNLEIKLPNLAAQYKGKYDAAAQVVDGTFSQGGATFPLKLTREEQEKQELKRPQNPVAPFPYAQEDVTYDNPAAQGVTLAGTLTLPKGDGPFPAVILISGSGPQNRDEELLGHKPFLVIADHFTRNGIAVLRFDDRGVGQSTGDFATATSADFATDVQAGVEYLKTRKEINARKIGLAGHSEGGLIAPMVAAKSADVAFIVLMAGPGVSGDKVIRLQSRLISKAEGKSEQEIKADDNFLKTAFKELKKTKNIEATRLKLKNTMMKEMEKLPAADKEKLGNLDQVATSQVNSITSPWFRYFLFYDPATSLEKVKCPVMAINGGKDLQVDPNQNLPAISSALKKGGNTRFVVKEIPGLNHLFQHTDTGKPSEYAEIEETIAPEALNYMTGWILEQTK
ncbi:MAG: alpha/beta hydrolase [Lewinellaceae bacterium]|nr:alpha/beta hydrolase [Lewinella sp.]MCB9279460.1 alpha/beta hydrolase [Lewinellaceae bacterium]